MPKIFSTDIHVAMTVYINADTEEAALEIIKGLKGNCIELPTGDVYGDFDGEITSATINANLPEISFSPAATIKEAYDLNAIELSYDSDEDEEYDPEDEED